MPSAWNAQPNGCRARVHFGAAAGRVAVAGEAFSTAPSAGTETSGETVLSPVCDHHSFESASGSIAKMMARARSIPTNATTIAPTGPTTIAVGTRTGLFDRPERNTATPSQTVAAS